MQYTDSNILIYQFTLDFIDSNMYLLFHEKHALIIDPHISESLELLLMEKDCKDVLILLTHEHYDHTSGVNRLREILPCHVICSETCAKQIQSPETNSASYIMAFAVGKPEQTQQRYLEYCDTTYSCHADETFRDTFSFLFGNHTVSLCEAPGHSPGGQLITIDNHYIFSGDNLIKNTKVITRLPGGSKQQYKEITMPLLKALPKDALFFPGHGEFGFLNTI